MRQQSFLSEFELMVLCAVIRVGDEAYGIPISSEIEKQTGREVAMSTVYAALERLSEKGFVRSFQGEATQERGGRAKRYFEVTRAGVQALKQTRTALTNLWSGLPVLEGGRR